MLLNAFGRRDVVWASGFWFCFKISSFSLIFEYFDSLSVGVQIFTSFSIPDVANIGINFGFGDKQLTIYLSPSKIWIISVEFLFQKKIWPQSDPDMIYSSLAPKKFTSFTVRIFLWPEYVFSNFVTISSFFSSFCSFISKR